MSKRTTPSHTHNVLHLPILDILENSGICYSIKNSKSEYISYNSAFVALLGIQKTFVTDFDILMPEIAYEITHEDSLIFTSNLPDEQDRVLISVEGTEVVVRISRSVVEHNGEQLLVSILKDITKKSQEAQFEAYKQVLTEPEVFEKMLNRFSTLIFGSDSTQEIFEGVGNLCLELLNLEDLSIFLADHKNKILKQTLIVEKGQKLQYDADGGSFITLPLNKGIVGRCATTLETISVDNVALDMDYVADQIVCKSEIAVPIVFRNHLIGVLDSESSHLARYDNKIQSVLEGIASLLAIKLNELDKVKELESKNNELKSLIQGHPAGVAMLDREGNFITVSKRWMTQFTKKSKADLQGVNLFSLYPNLPIRWVKIIENAQKGEATTVKG